MQIIKKIHKQPKFLKILKAYNTSIDSSIAILGLIPSFIFIKYCSLKILFLSSEKSQTLLFSKLLTSSITHSGSLSLTL